MVRHRIRVHVFSGIEFMMFVFIVGPLTGAIAAVTVGAAALLVAFELLLIYKLWMATRSFTRELARLGEPVGAAGSAGAAEDGVPVASGPGGWRGPGQG